MRYLTKNSANVELKQAPHGEVTFSVEQGSGFWRMVQPVSQGTYEALLKKSGYRVRGIPEYFVVSGRRIFFTPASDKRYRANFSYAVMVHE